MANFLQQIKLDEELYDLHDSEFIIDTRTASGAALTGISKAPALFDGMQITFWLNYAAASNATLNLTLADGSTTGAIPCYYSGTTRLGTHYAAGNAVHFTYRENVTIGSTTVARGWWGDANYTVSDTNYDIVGTSIPIKTRLNAYCLCGMVGTSGTIAKQTNTVGAGTYWKINAFTQSSGTGTSKKLVPNQGYYPGKIFYYTGSSAITDASSVSGTISGGTSNVDLRYTVNGSTSANIGVTGAPFFLVGSLGSDGLFYPNGHASEATKEWWQCGFPTDLTSTYIYWYVGMMSSKYQCRLSDTNWMLKSDGTKWIVFDGAMSSGVSWNDITGKPTEFTPASHTHGYIGNDGSVAPSVSASPASGDKILISDLTDSNKVKGGPEIGSNDGKFLRHDGAWDFPDDHILVMTGIMTSTSSPITTTTSWTDFVNAVNNRDRLVLEIASTAVNINLQVIGSELDDPSPWVELTGNALMPSGTRYTNIILSMKATPQDNNVSFTTDLSIPTVVQEADFAAQASEAESIPWLGITSNPYPTTPPPDNGNYSLNVSNGTTSWTTASSGPNTPDAPTTDGNYVLNVDSGGSSWQEETKEVVVLRIYDNDGDPDWDGEYPRYVWRSSQAEVEYALSHFDANDIDIILKVANWDWEQVYYLANSIYAVFYRAYLFCNFLPADTSFNTLYYHYFGFIPILSAYPAVSSNDSMVMIGDVNLLTSNSFATNSALSSASLSGGTTPTITYAAATASKATLTNGLLSFGDVSASNITNWSAGSMPTISTNTITVVTPASS